MSVFIDLHILQTVPPSCVNRDDTGSPKTAIYGGTVRARVSSQSWKHAVREKFKELFDKSELGIRTKKVVEMVAQYMQLIDPSLDKKQCIAKATNALCLSNIGIKEIKAEDTPLLFLNRKQIRAIADKALSLDLDDKKNAKEFKKEIKMTFSKEIYDKLVDTITEEIQSENSDLNPEECKQKVIRVFELADYKESKGKNNEDDASDEISAYFLISKERALELARIALSLGKAKNEEALAKDIKRYFKINETIDSQMLSELVDIIAAEMLENNSSLDKGECRYKAEKALLLAGIKENTSEDDSEEANALFFISNMQAKAIAELALTIDLNDKNASKILQDALKSNPSVDIALFGRMVAKAKILSVDASAQVAHAISTHAVQNEFDFFTAVDDLQKKAESGAAHIGTREFNSATLYRYATVNATELAETIGADKAAETIKKFAQAFIFSMPDGSINPFANNTIPDATYITIRRDQPVNLCGAFEKPIRKSEDGFAEPSKKRLMEYAEKVYRQYASKPEKSWLNDLNAELSLPDLLNELEKAVNEIINGV